MAEAVVIGAGFGGLGAALRLRAKGYDVTVVDRCERLGGRAQVFERNGFRHDAGPTVITAPFLFDELFGLFGKNREDYITFTPLDPWYRFHFLDGRTFDYGSTLEGTLQEIERFNPGDVDGYRQLLKHAEKIFDVGFSELSDKPFDSVATMLRQVPNLARLGCYRSVWGMVSHYLKDPCLRQAFSIHPLLVGGNPFDTTCIYCLIHYLERKWGIHFAMGGTGALVDALTGLMTEEGIRIQLGATVEKLATRGNRVKEIVLEDGRQLSADLVVSNADPQHLYRNMLSRDSIRPSARLKTKQGRLSMGLYVLYFGTTKQYPAVAHHTIWMGARFKELLRDIFKADGLPEDFSLYVHRPTATDADFAPPGCDSFYVLAPVPNLQANIDWKQEGPRLQERIVAALDNSLLPGLRNVITDPFFMTPRDFESDYLSYKGSGFSIAPLFSQSAWFRYHNRAEGPENLFLVGAGTHPGAGVPGVLSSAKLVDRIIPPVKTPPSSKLLPV